MQNSSRVRKHLSSERREQILQAWRGSSLTPREFAAQAGLGVSTLYAWRRKAEAKAGASGTQFVSVPNLLSTVPAAPAYRLQWPGGLSLEVRAGFAAAELAALLQLLPAL